MDFSEKSVRRQWALVNDWYEQLADPMSEAPNQLMQLIKATMELGMNLRRYQELQQLHAAGIQDKGNGFYERSLDTSFGHIPALQVPRLRRHRFPSAWFSAYQRRWQKVDRLLLHCLMGGLTTRKAVKIMNRHFHWGLSPSTLSRLAEHLHEALTRFRHCPLTDDYIGLMIDGAWFRFRQLYGPERVVLAVLGLKTDGTAVLLTFHVARSESALEVGRLLRNLKERGLHGRNLKIIVADGAEGIQTAAAEIFPWAPFQRCCWHHLQTLKAHATNGSIGRQLMHDAAHCYQSANLASVQLALQKFFSQWAKLQPAAIQAFRRSVDQTLTFLSLAPATHRWFRTTNILERLFRSIRARTKLIGSFAQPVHLEQFLIGTIMEIQWIHLPCDLQPLFPKDTIN